MAETKKQAAKAKTTSGDEAARTETAGRGLRKTQEGIVVSSKMDKTIVVATVRQVRHSAYGKFVRKTKKFYAHDEVNQSGVGDRVRIVETRPLSKLKCWKLETVLRKAE